METEKDFLEKYSTEKYEKPSVTTDIAAFTIRSEKEDSYRHNPTGSLSILLIKRGGHPFKDCWALPGGFLQPGETVEQCALREITEETNITPTSLMPVGVFSDIGRDPRGWIISNAFVSVIGEDSIKEAGGDDAADARWFNVQLEEGDDGIYNLVLSCKDTVIKAFLKEKSTLFNRTEFEIIESDEFAFDHLKIIATALTAIRNQAKNFDLIFDFLPEKFTLSSLQRVQETVMNISVVPANFRRKIADYVVETDEYTTGAGHRPAKLFKRKQNN